MAHKSRYDGRAGRVSEPSLSSLGRPRGSRGTQGGGPDGRAVLPPGRRSTARRPVLRKEEAHMKVRVAFAMLLACVVTGLLPTAAGAAMHDGNNHAVCHNAH